MSAQGILKTWSHPAQGARASWAAAGFLLAVLMTCLIPDARADHITITANKPLFRPQDPDNIIFVTLVNDTIRQGFQLDLTYNAAVGFPTAVEPRGRLTSGVQAYFSTLTPGVIRLLAYDSSATRAAIAVGADPVFGITFAIRDTVPDSSLVVTTSDGLSATSDLSPVAIPAATHTVALCPCPPPVPTLVLSFTATPLDDGRIRIAWLLSSTDGAPVTNLYRVTAPTGEKTMLNRDPFVGTGPHVYLDTPLGDLTTLTYEITELSLGRETILGQVQVASEERVPVAFALYQSAPNPFSSATKIRYDVPRQSHVRIAVYDVAGRLIRVLRDEDARPGRYSISWDGHGSRGQTLGAGIYFYAALMEKQTFVRRVVLIQ